MCLIQRSNKMRLKQSHCIKFLLADSRTEVQAQEVDAGCAWARALTCRSMFAQDLVLKQRTVILHALCSSGSAEHLEQVLDILLAQGELIWEDYQNIQVPGRALHRNARQLLDLVYTKGEESCGLFLSALKQVLPAAQGASLSFSGCAPNLENKEEAQSTSTLTLLSQRPDLVFQLQPCIKGILETLVESNHFTSADCDDVRLPVHTPTQQVSTNRFYTR